MATAALVAGSLLWVSPARASVVATIPDVVDGRSLVLDGELMSTTGTTQGDLTGLSSSAHGDILVMGTSDDGGPCPGDPYAIEIFRRVGSGWAQEQRIAQPDPYVLADPLRGDIACHGNFGASVSTDGTRVAVAARATSADPSWGSPAGGAAYVYGRSSAGSWAVEAELHAPPDGTVAGVSISGTRLAVYLDTTSGGSRIDFFTEVGGVWQPAGSVVGTLPMAMDGNTFLWSSSGAVRAAHLNSSGSWVLTQTLAGLNNITSMSFSDGLLAVGGSRPATYAVGTVAVYRQVDDVFGLEADLTDPDETQQHPTSFGRTVSVSSGRVLVGAPATAGGAVSTGGAYLYERGTGGEWSRTRSIRNPTDDNEFGYVVALSQTAAGVHSRAYSDHWGALLSVAMKKSPLVAGSEYPVVASV